MDLFLAGFVRFEHWSIVGLQVALGQWALSLCLKKERSSTEEASILRSEHSECSCVHRSS